MSSSLSPEQTLATFVASASLENMPASAVEAFQRIVLDSCAVIIAGINDSECREVAGTLLSGSTAGVASVAGRPGLESAADAAFANGVFAHWFDWDETHDRSHVHGAAVILPAMIAASEEAARHGKPIPADIFVATGIAAFDIANRIGLLLKDNGHRGWMPTGSGGTVAAAAAAARLSGQNERGILSAMGIAAAGAGLSRQALLDRSNGKNILAGLASRRAVEAARLSCAKVDGAVSFLSGLYGLHELHCGGHGDIGDIASGLGQEFAVEETSLKPYPCCRSTHAVIDAVSELRKGAVTDSERVSEMHIRTPVGAYERCGRAFDPGLNPRLAAQFSIPFTSALALSRDSITCNDFQPGNVLAAGQKMASLLSRIVVRADESTAGSDEMVPISVRVVLDDGSELQAEVRELKGSPARPLTQTDLEKKLHSACDGNDMAHVEEALLDATASITQSGPDRMMQTLRDLT